MQPAKVPTLAKDSLDLPSRDRADEAELTFEIRIADRADFDLFNKVRCAAAWERRIFDLVSFARIQGVNILLSRNYQPLPKLSRPRIRISGFGRASTLSSRRRARSERNHFTSVRRSATAAR